MKPLLIAPLLATALLLPACTTEQVYETGQAYQRNQCGRILDKAEYDRCVGNTNTTYDSYKRETKSESDRSITQ